MSRRNVWLKFDEWELICNELSDQKYHSFKLNSHELKEWKETTKRRKEVWNLSEEPKCFQRVGIYPEVEYVKSARALNILCREDWREQDIYNVMRTPHSFIGFIINYCDNVNMDTTFDEWEEIRKNMRSAIDATDQRYWSYSDLISLYTNSNKKAS